MKRDQLKIGETYEAQECSTQKWVKAKLFAKNLQTVTVEWQEGVFSGQRSAVGYYEVRPLVKWPDDSLIGVKVRHGNSVRTIASIYKDIPGGVRLNEPIGDFVSWNMDELERVKE